MISFNNKVISFNNLWIYANGTPLNPYNPLGLPPNTIRVRFSGAYVPTEGDIQTRVSYGVWDIYKESNDWTQLITNNGHLAEVLGANTTNVTCMDGMLYGNPAIGSVPLFDTSNVTSMVSMFNDCDSLRTVPLYNTSNVTNMANMFKDCSSLRNVPLFNTTNVTNMSNMFNDCRSLETVQTFNTLNVTDMSYMFNDCHSLLSIPSFDTSNVTTMSYMFNECNSLRSDIPLFNTSKVTDMERMFYDCTNILSGALSLYQQASSQTNPPTNHNQTFYICGSSSPTGEAELAQIPNDWK